MITLQPWSDRDLDVLNRTVGDPAMMAHLGGIETPEQIIARHMRHLDRNTAGRMFTIQIDDGLLVAGTIGFWETTWRDEAIYETGWMVLPEYGGRGIATLAALQIVEMAKSEGRHRFMHAFPSAGNAASNAVCRKAGFVNLGVCEWEYPKGHIMRCNDWRFDLSSITAGRTARLRPHS